MEDQVAPAPKTPTVRPCAAAMGVLGTPAVRWRTKADLFAQLEEGRRALERLERVSAAAACAGLSLHHFVRLFHERYGKPPHAYLRGCRVDRAKALLAGGMGVGETALEVRFASPSAFGRWFLRETGVRPSEYRRRGG